MSQQSAAWLAVRALEQVGVRLTFGIPGVHNTELYDELDKSTLIEPVLVTSEFNGAFMADATTRVGGSLGCLVLVPAAGLAHAASGIGEAMLDGIAMLVITGGVRTDIPYRYQLHQIDQLEVARGLTKAAFRVTSHSQVMSTIFEAARIARSGMPGPVLVELPVNLQVISDEAGELPDYLPEPAPTFPDYELLEQAAKLLNGSQRPAIFVGWGARHARAALLALAERLQAPVVTTLQGLASFPHDSPFHAGFGFGPSAVPAARHSVADHDVMVAIGLRFGEIATGSYGIEAPRHLIHIDIEPEVLNANYPAQVALCGDARAVVEALLPRLDQRPGDGRRIARIQNDKRANQDRWLLHPSGLRVNPGMFFRTLRSRTDNGAIMVSDDGNHTFLAAELWSVPAAGDFISPTDFNAMGYAIPAAIAAKLNHSEREVLAIVGDGCMRMSVLELCTASARKLGVQIYIFADGELSQIAQAQELPYARKVCTVLPPMDIGGLAQATGCAYVRIEHNADIDRGIERARDEAARGRPVIVEVAIDYSKPTAFSKGTLLTNFKRLPTHAKLRFVGRALWRRVGDRRGVRDPRAATSAARVSSPESQPVCHSDSSSTPKVLIVGTGAIGASLAGWLAPHYSRLYVTDVGDSLAALKCTGITIYQTDQPDATRETVEVRVIDRPQDLPDVDIVIIAVKNYHLAAVSEQLAQVYGSDRLIVSMANGTDNQQILSRLFKRVIYCVVGYNAKRDADVVVGYQKKGPLLLGTPDNTLQNELHQVQAILNLGCETEIVDRLDDSVHTKLVMNLTNALDSLVGHGVVPLSDFPSYQRLVINTLWEGACIIQAVGYHEQKIKGMPSFFLLWLGTIMPAWISGPLFKHKIKAMVISSMTQDVLLRGAQASELESLTGYIVRLAASIQMPAPYNQTIYRLGRERFHPGFKPMRCEDVLTEVKKSASPCAMKN